MRRVMAVQLRVFFRIEFWSKCLIFRFGNECLSPQNVIFGALSRPAGAFLGGKLINLGIKSTRRGLFGRKNAKLRIQGRMQIFEKMSQMALNQVLILPS